MAFATTDDVGARLGRTLTAGEETTVDYLLDAASQVAADAVGQTVDALEALTPDPPALRFITVELVCRALANPSGLDSLNETVGSYTYGARFRDSGLSLTPAERLALRRAVNGVGIVSAPLGSILDGST